MSCRARFNGPIGVEALAATAEFDAPAMDREPILKTFSRAKPPRQQKVTKVVAPVSQGASDYGADFEPDRRGGSVNTTVAPRPRPRMMIPGTPIAPPPVAPRTDFSNRTQRSASVPFSQPESHVGSFNTTAAPRQRSPLSIPVVPGPPSGLALHPDFAKRTQESAPVESSQPGVWEPEITGVQPDSFVKDQLVAGLGERNFEPFLRSKEAVLVFFYDPFNKNSYYPNTQIKQAANETTRDNHAYAAVNCMLESELCKKQGITELPAFKLFSQGVPLSTIRHMATFDAKTMKTYVEKTPELAPEIAAKRSCTNEGALITVGTFSGHR